MAQKKVSEIVIGDRVVDEAGKALKVTDVGRFPIIMELDGVQKRAIHLVYDRVGFWSNMHPDAVVEVVGAQDD